MSAGSIDELKGLSGFDVQLVFHSNNWSEQKNLKHLMLKQRRDILLCCLILHFSLKIQF